MAEFGVLAQPYDLEAAHAADCSSDCLTVVVSHGFEPYEFAEKCGADSATKLYVIGSWDSSFATATLTKGVEKICDLLEMMPMLRELTWHSELPFMDMVWDYLPKTMKKLVLYLEQPLTFDMKYVHERYISQKSMKPLVNFTQLEELRLLGMHDSFQCIVWETVFRNEALGDGMHVLDLQMAKEPLVDRMAHWVTGNDVSGLHVSVDPDYKGGDGRGTLHHRYGFGEYLDHLAMKKGRIASEIGEAKPLPLWCLKLDGFVVDHLPFERELSRIVLLTCGEHCVDAGLRAPEIGLASTLNKWGSSIRSENTHCYIVWPNWAGIFDNQGRLLDAEGNLALEGDTRDQRAITNNEADASAPLTEDALSLKDLQEALDKLPKEEALNLSWKSTDQKGDYDSALTSLEGVSVASTRGSAVPTYSMKTGFHSTMKSTDTEHFEFINGEVADDVEIDAGSDDAVYDSDRQGAIDGMRTPPNLGRKRRKSF